MIDSDISNEPVVPATAPSPPRLFLTSARGHHGLLQGGWWPRSWDPVAELPGLIITLCARFGPIWGMDLNHGTWLSHANALAMDAGVVHLGWPITLHPALLTAIGEHEQRIALFDLLVVPPSTSAPSARQAMTAAADPANLLTAPEILTALSITAGPRED